MIAALGSFCNETMIVLRTPGKKLSPLKILIPSIFNAFLLCAINDYFKVSFQIYMFICFFMGMWSYHIMKAFTNLRFVAIILKAILKAFKDPISKGIIEAVDEIDKIKEQEKTDTDTKDKPNNDKEEKKDTE